MRQILSPTHQMVLEKYGITIPMPTVASDAQVRKAKT